MKKYSRIDDRAVLEEAWGWHAKFMPDAPYPPVDGYQLVLKISRKKIQKRRKPTSRTTWTCGSLRNWKIRGL